MRSIALAREFSKFPGGRYRSKGVFSGEEFRDEFLIPALKAEKLVVVQLDGTEGYGSSFLEEAFGGLVRKGFDLAFLKERLKPVAESPAFKEYVDEIWQYIVEASQRSVTS